ncbi:sensor histidine kinase [Chryseolinea sp. T2]|uniref:sensor histidine kinase n=1 Tax=Chryseolinea sp. T2 TaxID=3129255 RepID=UPI0030778637
MSNRDAASLLVRDNIGVIVQVLAWALFGFILFIHPVLTWSIDIPREFWVKQVMHYTLLAGIYLLNARVLVPRLLINSKHVQYTLVVILIVLLMQVASRGFDLYTDLPRMLSRAWGVADKHKTLSFDLFVFFLTVMVIALSASVTLVGYYRLNTYLKEQSEKQNINAELLFLRSQINPHFFFNTLNTIYSLTYTNVEHSRESLLRLSRMMRYALNKNEEGLTPISSEVSFIRDYVDLMKLRLRTPESVALEIHELKNGATVAPMLLLPFIENAFKYGSGSDEHHNIRIVIRQTFSHLQLLVSNYITKSVDDAHKSKVGIANTSRRLALLYPDKHHLKHGRNDNDNTYVVTLEIAL